MNWSRVTAWVITAFLVTPSVGQGQDTQESAQRTVLDSVYTEAQAQRGSDTFLTVCVQCHEEAEFTDKVFHDNWAGQAVFFLHDHVLTLMPDDNPGILTREEVSDVLAYILKLNGFAPGETELPTDADALRAIVWTAPPGAGR